MHTAARPQNEQQTSPEITYVRADYARGVKVPWTAKMVLKILLAKLPVPYSFWEKLGIFRHGDINKNLAGLHKGYERVFEAYTERFQKSPEAVLELGPGDSIGHALSAYVRGAKKNWLIDVGDFASREETHYKAYCDYLKALSLFGEDIKAPDSFSREKILEHAHGTYMTRGLSDLQSLPAGVLDLSYSSAVFEHIRRTEFQDHMYALHKAHKPGSLSWHAVDLHDHLGGALNSMRFSEDFWESPHVQNAGFYTNRLTMDEMLDAAAKAGFKTEVKKIIKWVGLPIPHNKMQKPFREKPEEELNIRTFFVQMIA